MYENNRINITEPGLANINIPNDEDYCALTIERCDDIEIQTVHIEHVESITAYRPPQPQNIVQQIIRVIKPEKPIILKDDIFKQVALRRKLEKE